MSVRYNEGATVIAVALFEPIPRGQRRSNRMARYTDVRRLTSSTACYKQTWKLSTSGHSTSSVFIREARTNTLHPTVYNSTTTPVTAAGYSRLSHGPFCNSSQTKLI